MSQRERPTEQERQAAREYLEHDYARRHLTGKPAHAAHENAEQLLREHPRARTIALAGGTTDLGRLPAKLRAHQLRERAAAGISTRRAAELRRRGYPEASQARRRSPRERFEDAADTARGHGRELVSAGGGALSDVADTSWGALIGQVFLWGIGLSILYLLLTHDTAVSKLALGATNVTRAIVSPVVDPLNPKGALA